MTLTPTFLLHFEGEPFDVPSTTTWKPIDYLQGYWISDSGLIFSMKSKKLMGRYINNKGVLCVQLYDTYQRRPVKLSVTKIWRRVYKSNDLIMFEWRCPDCTTSYKSDMALETAEYARMHRIIEHPQSVKAVKDEDQDRLF